MSRKTPQDKLADIRSFLFDAVDAWNVDHPQRLPSHREHASVALTETSEEKLRIASYTISINCKLVSHTPMIFHDYDLSTLLDTVRTTIEQKMAYELCRRFANTNNNLAA